MSDFEQRLRDTVVERSGGFESSPDLPDRITARVRRRHVRRRLAAGGLAAAAAAVVVVVGLVATGGDDEGSIRMSGRDPIVTPEDGRPASTTTTAADGSTTSSSTTATTATTTAPPTGPAIDVLTPLSREGIGPITAGMTLRQAQEVSGVTLLPSAPDSSGDCLEARLEGVSPSPVLIVEPVGADPMDGVVRAVYGPVTPIEEGIAVGSSRDEVLAALGTPTRTQDESARFGAGAELVVFESGGFAYGVLFTGDQVLGLQSGDPDWMNATDGCPT